MNHVIYLSRGRFDYGYNMQLNVFIGKQTITWKTTWLISFLGTFTAICWFGWCMWSRIRRPYVWKCAAFVALAGAAMLLEVVDQPPLLWIFDSHSLWHFFTAPLICLFYRWVFPSTWNWIKFITISSFVIDDCKYLRKQKVLDKETGPKGS